MPAFIILLLGTMTVLSATYELTDASWDSTHDHGSAAQIATAMVASHQGRVRAETAGNPSADRRQQQLFGMALGARYCATNGLVLTWFPTPAGDVSTTDLLNELSEQGMVIDGLGIVPSVGPPIGDNLTAFRPSGCMVGRPAVWAATDLR